MKNINTNNMIGFYFKLKHFFLIMCMLMTMASCELDNKSGAHEYIHFVNNSEKDIYVSYSPWTPDTLCYEIMQTHNNPQYKKIKAHSASDRPLGLGRYNKDTWENYFSNHSLGTVIIFIHDVYISDSICTSPNISWNVVDDDERQIFYSFLNEQIILKRYYYTLEELIQLNWIITYP